MNVRAWAFVPVWMWMAISVSPAAAAEILSAALNGNQEVPAQVSSGRGPARLAYNTVTKTLDLDIFVAGIVRANVTGFHLHRGPVGVNGPIVVPFDIGSFQDLAGGIRLTVAGVALPAADETNFLTGQMYLNVHTAAAPDGEIRGQVLGGPPKILVTGAGPGGGPHVRVLDPSGVLRFEFFAYDLAFSGGVRVASCDVNGDGFPDVVTGAGPGGGPHVRVFSGLTGVQLSGTIGSFFAFDPAFTGGVEVACADLDQDGKGDVIVGAGPGGGPQVRVFSGATGAQLSGTAGSFFAYSPAFLGGVFIGGSP